MRQVAIATGGISEAFPGVMGAGCTRSRVVAPAEPLLEPRRIAARSEEDIVHAVLRARGTGSRVRAIGAGGSKNGNTRTSGCQLDLAACDRPVSVDGHLVTVQAGMTVARLQEILDQCGLALPTPGEWNNTTVSGAVSTGTHGGSLVHGCLATSLEGLRLVTGRGTAMELRRGSDAFRHAGVSLGMMGVLPMITRSEGARRHGGLVRVGVTGANGCIGRALLARLGAAGDTEVNALCRRPASLEDTARPRRCRVVAGDLFDPDALAELVSGSDVVYHCAATMEKGDEERSHRVNVVGTENVASAALQAGVRRLVCVSSISVFAATRRRDFTITEDVEPENVGRLNHYSRTKLEGEHLLDAFSARGLACTVMRPTNVYGPWSHPWFSQWAEVLRRTPYIVGNVPIDVVHSDDVAAAMIRAAASPGAADDVFHVGNESVLLSDFIRRVGHVVQRPVRALPSVLDRALRHTIETGYRTVSGRVMSLSLPRPAIYPHAKAHRAFGYAPAISLDAGFASLKAWYSNPV